MRASFLLISIAKSRKGALTMSDSLDKEKQPLLVAGPVFSEGASEGFKRTAYDPNVCGGVAVLREYLHSFLLGVGA
jgi:hypothetical protein